MIHQGFQRGFLRPKRPGTSRRKILTRDRRDPVWRKKIFRNYGVGGHTEDSKDYTLPLASQAASVNNGLTLPPMSPAVKPPAGRAEGGRAKGAAPKGVNAFFVSYGKQDEWQLGGVCDPELARDLPLE